MDHTGNDKKKRLNKGSGRMSAMKKEGRTTAD
jgi:hypothetical protein